MLGEDFGAGVVKPMLGLRWIRAAVAFRALALVLAGAIAACGAPVTETGGATAAPAAPATGTPASAVGAASSDQTSVVLLAGEFRLPAAGSFGSPGFHEVLQATVALPDGFSASAGARLIVSLQDASRPAQACSRDHPLSGCATVDWSDSDGRPGVPPGGVFDNRLTLRTAAGEQSFFLSAAGALAATPDRFEPG